MIRLEEHREDVHSQFGEDGMIRKALEAVPGSQGEDHLQFFHSPDELGDILGRHFPYVMVRELEYGLSRESSRREAFWRCAVDPERLEGAGWSVYSAPRDRSAS